MPGTNNPRHYNFTPKLMATLKDKVAVTRVVLVADLYRGIHFPPVYEYLSMLRNKRKQGHQTDDEFEQEGIIAEALRVIGKYDEFLTYLKVK